MVSLHNGLENQSCRNCLLFANWLHICPVCPLFCIERWLFDLELEFHFSKALANKIKNTKAEAALLKPLVRNLQFSE